MSSRYFLTPHFYIYFPEAGSLTDPGIHWLSQTAQSSCLCLLNSRVTASSESASEVQTHLLVHAWQTFGHLPSPPVFVFWLWFDWTTCTGNVRKRLLSIQNRGQASFLIFKLKENLKRDKRKAIYIHTYTIHIHPNTRQKLSPPIPFHMMVTILVSSGAVRTHFILSMCPYACSAHTHPQMYVFSC